jgi:nucleotide-binding universal stress UspA family protein
MTRMQTIIAGTDGSETANRAVTRAAKLASETGAILHIVMTYKAPSLRKFEAERASLPEEFRWSLADDTEAQNILKKAAAHASTMGVTAETHLARGKPAKVILKKAKDLGADTIVVWSKSIERKIRRGVPSSESHNSDRDVRLVRTTTAPSVTRFDFGHGRPRPERRRASGAPARTTA